MLREHFTGTVDTSRPFYTVSKDNVFILRLYEVERLFETNDLSTMSISNSKSSPTHVNTDTDAIASNCAGDDEGEHSEGTDDVTISRFIWTPLRVAQSTEVG